MFEQTISKTAKNVLADLAAIDSVKDFYLAGGTACALQLGHRQSIDLDFFTPKKFSPDRLLDKLKEKSPFEIYKKETEVGTLSGLWQKVKLEFFYYSYPAIFPKKNYAGIKLADVRDIALMKITTIADRGAKKDFIDIYEICQNIIPLEELFGLMSEKFKGVKYNEYHLLRSLTYFEDAESHPMPNMLKSISWEEVKKYIQAEVNKIKL